ncbi:MAG: GIY-YIG nuclease family protein [bacterium]|nr:GIY-YIG nuclease family protein [bacterium]
MKPWFVYIVRCSDDSLYTGISNDIKARVKRHNDGQGAKYTRSRRPVKLMLKERMKTASAARKREYEIKTWNKVKKEKLVSAGRSKRKRV